MLDTVPIGSVEFQCPKDVGIPGNVMRLAIRIYEPKGEVIIRKGDLPSYEDLVHQCFMYAFKRSMNETVGPNGLSNGEEYMSNEPGIAVDWFL